MNDNTTKNAKLDMVLNLVLMVAIPAVTFIPGLNLCSSPASIAVSAVIALWCAFDAYRDYVKISSAKSAAVSA